MAAVDAPSAVDDLKTGAPGVEGEPKVGGGRGRHAPGWGVARFDGIFVAGTKFLVLDPRGRLAGVLDVERKPCSETAPRPDAAASCGAVRPPPRVRAVGR